MDPVNNGSALQSLLRRENRVSPVVHEEEIAKPTESEYEAFSFGRVGIRPQLMLALRKSNGQVRVRPYAVLQSIDTDDENSSFRLEFPGLQVEIKGRNLGKLFRFLWVHRVEEIIEADMATQFTQAESDCVVESLEFEYAMASPQYAEYA